MSNSTVCKRAIYPGSFDPITNGHINLASRASKFFDEVIIAVAESSAKKTLFTTKERIELIEKSTEGIEGIKVVGFSGLLIDFANEVNASVVIRGLRAVSDFEYEFQLAWMNRQLNPDIETLFFAPGAENAFVSATLVKEIAELGGNAAQFLHPAVYAALRDKLTR